MRMQSWLPCKPLCRQRVDCPSHAWTGDLKHITHAGHNFLKRNIYKDAPGSCCFFLSPQSGQAKPMKLRVSSSINVSQFSKATWVCIEGRDRNRSCGDALVTPATETSSLLWARRVETHALWRDRVLKHAPAAGSQHRMLPSAHPQNNSSAVWWLSAPPRLVSAARERRRVTVPEGSAVDEVK
jgi:hypothetical protein